MVGRGDPVTHLLLVVGLVAWRCTVAAVVGAVTLRSSGCHGGWKTICGSADRPISPATTPTQGGTRRPGEAGGVGVGATSPFGDPRRTLGDCRTPLPGAGAYPTEPSSSRQKTGSFRTSARLAPPPHRSSVTLVLSRC